MTPTLSIALQILVAVESGGNPKAFNAEEQAVGILQIRPVLVADVNRIVGEPRFSHSDAWDPGKSLRMATLYLEHYGTRERLGREPRVVDYALLWCAGPDGPRQKITPALRNYLDRARQKALQYLKFVGADEFEPQGVRK